MSTEWQLKSNQQHSPGTMVRVTHAGLTDVGRVRRENQDRWFADPESGLYVVADGMGGTVDGGLASKIVVQVLPRLLRSRLPQPAATDDEMTDAIVGTVTELSDRLFAESEHTYGEMGIGSTLVLAYICDGKAWIVHLGDSRVYLFRDSKLELLTQDHSLAQLLVSSGEVTQQQAAEHPGRACLTRFVGMGSDPLPDSRLLQLAKGDRLLLCSDGLTGMLPDEQIAAIMATCAEPSDACERLVAAANAVGGKDNITALVVFFAG